jgi:hydroxylamine reductase
LLQQTEGKGINIYTHSEMLPSHGYPELKNTHIDLGQCNNSISTVKIAAALADAFGCEVNELPLSIVLSWFEQKAVAILLGLLRLGIQDIRIGPKAPHFISEGVMRVLQDMFGLKLIGDVEEDMRAMLA